MEPVVLGVVPCVLFSGVTRGFTHSSTQMFYLEILYIYTYIHYIEYAEIRTWVVLETSHCYPLRCCHGFHNPVLEGSCFLKTHPVLAAREYLILWYAGLYLFFWPECFEKCANSIHTNQGTWTYKQVVPCREENQCIFDAFPNKKSSSWYSENSARTLEKTCYAV